MRDLSLRKAAFAEYVTNMNAQGKASYSIPESISETVNNEKGRRYQVEAPAVSASMTVLATSIPRLRQATSRTDRNGGTQSEGPQNGVRSLNRNLHHLCQSGQNAKTADSIWPAEHPRRPHRVVCSR